MGTYGSKNSAIGRAAGEFVTFHDSDDWMHPQRLETHLRGMTADHCASISNWVRMTSDKIALVRKGGGIVHKNPASTFIRRGVFQRIGCFDSVRVGADSEFLSRMRVSMGQKSVVDIHETLALGLQHGNSLTATGSAAFDEHRFSSVRSRYAEAWTAYHIKANLESSMLHLPYPASNRKFYAPQEIL